MYRNAYINQTNGERELLWCGTDDNGEIRLYTDLTLSKCVDESNYVVEEVVDDNGEKEVKLPTPYTLFGIECGKGWYPLIQPVVDYIDEYNSTRESDKQIRITQVKEKYGTLRIYTNFYTPELQELIDNAELESEKVCEFCGSREHLGTTLEWYITICYDCMKARVNRRGIPSKWHSYENDKVYISRPHVPDELLGTIKEYEEDVI